MANPTEKRQALEFELAGYEIAGDTERADEVRAAIKGLGKSPAKGKAVRVVIDDIESPAPEPTETPAPEPVETPAPEPVETPKQKPPTRRRGGKPAAKKPARKPAAK